MADGSITFSTELDNKQLEKQLQALTKKIGAIEDKIAQKHAAKMPLVKQSAELAANLDAAKAKLDYMRSGKEFFTAASIQEQAAAVKSMEAEYGAVERRVERYDASIQNANMELDRQKEKAGAVAQELARAGRSSDAMRKATEKAQKSMNRFTLRLKEVVRSALIFTVITQSLAALRGWTVKVIKANDKASESLARLKAAALTLAQPLVEMLVPVLTDVMNLLTQIVTSAAKLASVLFGTTIDQSKESAENLYDETEALEGTGAAAKKAAKSLASFDEINRLSDGQGEKDADKIKPDFSGVNDGSNWLKDRLGEAAGMVSSALILGGIALVAFGAAFGSLKMVIAGLFMIGSGMYVAEQTGALQPWADVLGLNSVEEGIASALALGGIAMVAIGAATGNILLVVAGLLLIGYVAYYAEKSGMVQDWADALGLDKAPQCITAGLLIGGAALVVFGILANNVLMVISGLGLIQAGVYIGKSSGVLGSWWDALGLEKAYSWLSAIFLISGMALVVFGIVLKNISMIIAGVGLVATGIIVGATTGTFQNWWDALGLPQVQGWITEALLIGGMALIVFGILLKNFLMIIGGFLLLNMGVAYGQESGTFQSWWDALGLPNAEKWITAIMIIAGIGLTVIGIVTANVPAFLMGLVLLGVGINFGEKSGTFASWSDALHLDDVAGKVTAAIMLAGIALIAIGALMMNPLMIFAGLALLGAGAIANHFTAKKTGPASGGGTSAVDTRNIAAPTIASYNIPRLATGAVIPPNREFMAVLGDQKSGTNIEAPVSEIEAAVARGIAAAGGTGVGQITVIMEMDRQRFGRAVYELNKEQTQRVGVHMIGG